MMRREFLASLLACAALPAHGQQADGPVGLRLGAAEPFDHDDLRAMARRMAAAPHVPAQRIPQAWSDINYDTYRAIWFDTRNALWQGEAQAPFRVDMFPPGLYFPTPVRMDVIEDGTARPVLFDMQVFDRTDRFPDLPVDDTLGYSGFRLRAELETPGIYTEFAVFQGASYFRGIGTGQIYGLSARGLALDTGEPSGEEFAEFRHFWIERPDRGANAIIVHALLDSPSCTGAYRFRIRPGAALEIGVEAEVFARRQLRHVGLGALTSMFQFDATNRDRFSDFRPAVHDSDGLLIHNGAGETLWRPLANPRELQLSAFRDNDPRGFGLMQRSQDFDDFSDLEALYHRRPSVWIVPRGGWGRGAVTLVEIPTEDEIYDNIVAYWRPDTPVEGGGSLAFAYDMSWSGATAWGNGLRVIDTRAGQVRSDGIIFAVDFENGPDLPADLGEVRATVRSSAGEVSTGILQRNPSTGGARFSFTLRPGTATLAEMRAELRTADGAALSETWLYRWTAE